MLLKAPGMQGYAAWGYFEPESMPPHLRREKQAFARNIEVVFSRPSVVGKLVNLHFFTLRNAVYRDLAP